MVAVDESQMEIAAINAIDKMEQDFLREYYMIAERDKAAGKDFNKVARDEMQKAQFQFAMLRKIEK